MRHPRAACWIGIVAGVTILLAGVATMARWTLIPLGLDTSVVEVGYSDGSGGHFRTLGLDDGRTVTVERGFIERHQERLRRRGVTIRKQRWDRQVLLDGHPVPLQIPVDIWLTVAALTVPIALGLWLRWRAWRRDLQPATSPTERA